MKYKCEEYKKKTFSNLYYVLIYKVSNQNSELCYSHTLNGGQIYLIKPDLWGVFYHTFLGIEIEGEDQTLETSFLKYLCLAILIQSRTYFSWEQRGPQILAICTAVNPKSNILVSS